MSDSSPFDKSAVVDWPKAFQAHYKAMGLWEDLPLSHILDSAVQRFPEHVAVIDQQHQWTYQQLHDKASQLAVGLVALGIHRGDRVVLQLPNCGELFEVLFALFKIGAIPVLALPAHRGLEIRYFIEFTQAKAYITCDKAGGFDYRQLARLCCEDFKSSQVLVVGDAQEFTPLKDVYKDGEYQQEGEASDVALLQLSGGTTGIPKLIPRTHNDYLYSVRASAELCELDQHTVYLAVLPVLHNFPLSSPGALGTFYAGGTVVLSQSGAPDIAFPLIENHKVTHCALVPPLAITWMNALKGADANLVSLKVLQVGGAKFSSEVANRFYDFFDCKLQQVFGMAEGLVNYTRLSDERSVITHTQGKPLSPFDEVRVLDEDDRPVKAGEVGHLVTRGPYTIRGYYQAPEHNLKSFTADGFYRTGDLVRLTDKGYLVVEGRDKDQINRGGEKISAEEVENQLLAHVLISDVAVVAMLDEFLGERTCAFIIPKDLSNPISLIQARKFLRARGLAEYKLPDRIEVVDHFPTTKLGKVSKKDLRKKIEVALGQL